MPWPPITKRPIDEEKNKGDWRNIPTYPQKLDSFRGGQFTPSPWSRFASQTVPVDPYDLALMEGKNREYEEWKAHQNRIKTGAPYFTSGLADLMNNADNSFADQNLNYQGSLHKALQNSHKGIGGLDPLSPGEPKSGWGSLFGDAWGWMKSNPLDAAKIGLGFMNYRQKNRQLDQWDDYQDDVRAQMAFDQKDVDRRWDLTMKDWETRQARDAAFDHSQRLATV